MTDRALFQNVFVAYKIYTSNVDFQLYQARLTYPLRKKIIYYVVFS